MTKIIILCAMSIMTFTSCQENHSYDYILEVDATDSIEIIHIYDYMHNPVGSFTTAHPDSLQIILDQDNL